MASITSLLFFSVSTCFNIFGKSAAAEFAVPFCVWQRQSHFYLKSSCLSLGSVLGVSRRGQPIIKNIKINLKNFQDLTVTKVCSRVMTSIKTQGGMLKIGFNQNESNVPRFCPNAKCITRLPVSLADFSIPEALSMKLMQGT